MSLGLTKPGASAALRHPKTGRILEPVGILPSGKVVWPVLGASSDDPDDPAYTGGGSEEDDEDDEDDEDEEPSRKRRPVKKTTKSEEDDDDEDEDDKPTRPERQAARYRTRLRDTEKERDELKTRLKALEDRDRPEDEVVNRDLSEARAKIDALSETNRIMQAQLAFFKTPVPGVDWIDASDVFALAEREGLFDDVIDEDGTVDQRELRRGLKDLAKRKPHLVKKLEDDPKARGRKSKDDEDEDDEEDDDDEPRSRRSAAPMNSTRKGKRAAGPTRDQLAKKFPVLGRI